MNDVKVSEMTPHEGVLGKGFGSGALWLKLNIDPHLAADKNTQAKRIEALESKKNEPANA